MRMLRGWGPALLAAALLPTACARPLGIEPDPSQQSNTHQNNNARQHNNNDPQCIQGACPAEVATCLGGSGAQ
ncbi:MAG: hypothetical protein ABI333_25120 [bacterium]